jgi:hypothetical protein
MLSLLEYRLYASITPPLGGKLLFSLDAYLFFGVKRRTALRSD